MAKAITTPKNGTAKPRRHVLILLACLVAVMALLFHKAFLPDWVIFNNDAPFGAKIRAAQALPDGLTGMWEDMNWVGMLHPAAVPDVTMIFLWLAGPLLYAKFWAGASLVILGLCAWRFFRELKFTPLACALGGLAAALNHDAFGNACWGQVSRPLALSAGYLALTALQRSSGRHSWVRAILAGAAVGMGIGEGFDIGAIFSVFIAAWIVAQALFFQEGAVAPRVGGGMFRLILVAGFAAFIAASTMHSLVGTQIKGVVGVSQDEQTKAMRWSEATQWSLPKREALGIMVPGLFGFRMDTPIFLSEGMQKSHAAGGYWGFMGRDAAWDQFLETDKQGPVPGGMMRYGGGGGYAGILVLLGAAWAVIQSFRGKNSFFTTEQRRMIWFWLGVMVVAMALMFGRFAPFFQLVYALPYVSAFRNPAKFIHVFEWALVVVFAFGMHGLTTLYLERATATTRGVVEQFGLWWKQTRGFDKKWVVGTLVALALAGLAWFGYSALRGKVEAYVGEMNQFATLQQGGKPDLAAAAEAAATTVSFSLGQVSWAVGFLTASVLVLAVLVSGGFAGKRARVAGILLGLLLAIDLGWQNRPWVIAHNWKERYVEAGNNPVFDFLRNKPFEHRVGSITSHYLRAFRLDPRLMEMEGMFQSVYGSEWTQQLFPYYNIQTLSVVQMPRRPLDYDVSEQVLQFYFNTNTLHHVARRWQLTNTRYIACAAPLVNLLNQAFDQQQQRFVPKVLFDFHQDRRGGPILIRTNPAGNYALVEFTGALPRAKLYSDWQAVPYDPVRVKAWTDSIRKVYPPDWPMAFDSVNTNDLATLELLTRATFDPAQTVLLAAPITTAPPTNATPGTVEYVSYQPKNIVLKTKSAAPGVLLLNDRYDPDWQVTVDGQTATLLRCNYLMRGVEVPAGEHAVEFHFRPPTRFLYVSLAAIAIALLLLGYVVVASRQDGNAAPAKG